MFWYSNSDSTGNRTQKEQLKQFFGTQTLTTTETMIGYSNFDNMGNITPKDKLKRRKLSKKNE